jgi:Na+/alanine symporter
MTGTFFDTIIICFMTGTVLIITDSWTADYRFFFRSTLFLKGSGVGNKPC